MRDYLAEIVEKKQGLVREAKQQIPLYDIQEDISMGTFAMSRAFDERPWTLIAECKLQSPSKGRFKHDYSVTELAMIYKSNGAGVLSIHTDPHFMGKNEDLQAVRQLVDIPLLRKDFIIDEYQIYEARQLGADAVLLITRILSPEKLKKFLFTAWELGMDALVEVHDRQDMEIALNTPARFIGINNRNLKLFETTIDNTMELLSYADKKRTIISESGIHTIQEVHRLYDAGLNGILVGEGLVMAGDVARQTREFALM